MLYEAQSQFEVCLHIIPPGKKYHKTLYHNNKRYHNLYQGNNGIMKTGAGIEETEAYCKNVSCTMHNIL